MDQLVTKKVLNQAVDTLTGTINAQQAELAELQDKLDMANRQVYIIQEGLSAALRLKNIEIAELKKKYAFSQYNYAGALMTLADIELKAAKEKSQCPSSSQPPTTPEKPTPQSSN